MGVVSSVTLLKAIRDFVKQGKLPEPEHTVRVVFAMEVYGFAAVYEALGTQVTDNVLGAINNDGLLEKCFNSYEVFKETIESVFYLAKYGYLSIVEK